MADDLDSSSKAKTATRSGHGSDRINPDSIVTLWLTVGLVCFLAVASFMVSFTGLHEVAEWAGLPLWLRWAVPVFIDVAILAYTMAVLIHRHRGERTWASWVSLAGFTLFSMIANGAHALSIPHPDDVQRVIGAAVASMAPVAVFAATEQLGRLAIRRPEVPGTPGSSLPIPGGNDVAQALSNPVSGSVEDPAPGATAPSPEQTPPTQLDPSPPLPAHHSADEPETGTDAGRQDPAPAPAPAPSPEPGAAVRPVLSVVGRKPRPSDFEGWARDIVASGEQPTGKGAAEFLGVSERTGRNRLNALKKEHPGLFDGVALKKGTNP